MATKHLGVPAAVTKELIAVEHVRGFMTSMTNGGWTPSLAGGYSGDTTTVGAQDMPDDRLFITPIIPARNCTVDQIAVRIEAAGSAGADDRFRFGIYRVDVDASTGDFVYNLVYDDGANIAYNATGAISRTLGTAQPLKFGVMYLFCISSQGAPLSNPDLWMHFPINVFPANFSTAALALNVTFGSTSATNYRQFYQDSVSGALPSTLTPTEIITHICYSPYFAIHCSA